MKLKQSTNLSNWNSRTILTNLEKGIITGGKDKEEQEKTTMKMFDEEGYEIAANR